MSELRHVLDWTPAPPRDLRALVEMAFVAEEAGFDTAMVSEHVALERVAELAP